MSHLNSQLTGKEVFTTAKKILTVIIYRQSEITVA